MPDKPANSPAGPQEGTRTTAGAAAGTCGLRVPSAPLALVPVSLDQANGYLLPRQHIARIDRELAR